MSDKPEAQMKGDKRTTEDILSAFHQHARKDALSFPKGNECGFPPVFFFFFPLPSMTEKNNQHSGKETAASDSHSIKQLFRIYSLLIQQRISLTQYAKRLMPNQNISIIDG